jgi:uncharacterized membrane protein
MRFSGLVIFVLLIVAVGFVYLGLSERDVSYRTQIDITAPVGIAFDGFTDASRMGEWMSGLDSVDLLRGEPGEVGSFYRLTFHEDGTDVIATQEVIAVESNTRVAYDLEYGNMTNVVEVLFEPTTNGTSMATYNTVSGKSLFWRAILRLRKNSMMDAQRTDHRRLKAMIEGD